MAEAEGAPYAPQDVYEVTELVRGLEANTKKSHGGAKKSFTCKKNTFSVAGTDGLTVESWKFNDWDYQNPDLPTYARGLFIHRTKQGKPEIAIRGYDKFFNTGEVFKTRWENIESHTRGPYELTVKENGCIIFISGLPDDTLLVCSKHSTGTRADVALSHAVAGEQWVNRQLEALGKTRVDLARELRRRNATAVAELCDDNFEEHVLAYVGDQAGLYLHGINLNLPEFATYPGSLVHKFADDWGFKKVEYFEKDDIAEVRTFLEGVAETGIWQGREIEGFVIRCQARDGDNLQWHDWFFKYKFEEPYLMYRQWREATKAIISARTPKFKKHVRITNEYLLYARRQLAADRTLGAKYQKNQGIIAMRDGFLKERGLTGAAIIQQEIEGGEEIKAPITKDVIIIPVATIGCGKTTVAIALQRLFKWGHIQNDNIEGKKNRPQRFASEIWSALLTGYPVVIADRNNHQKRERKQLIDDMRKFCAKAHFVALYYAHDHQDRIREAARDRVFNRGDRHQTIQADSTSQQEILGIMEGFMRRFEPLDVNTEPDEWFDAIIEVDPTVPSRDNLQTVVEKMHELYPNLFTDMPTGDDMDEAIEWALNDYVPAIAQDNPFSNKGGYNNKNDKRSQKHVDRQQSRADANDWRAPPKPPSIDYFSIKVFTNPLLTALDKTFATQNSQTQRFYKQLQQSRRIQASFHVTIIHRAMSKEFPDVWQRFIEKQIAAVAENQSAKSPDPTPQLDTCRVMLERVVWNDRVMAIVVRLLDAQDKGLGTTNEIAHITVGTADQTIKPKESNDMLHMWMNAGSGDETGIRELEIKGSPVLDGSVKAVMQIHQ